MAKSSESVMFNQPLDRETQRRGILYVLNAPDPIPNLRVIVYFMFQAGALPVIVCDHWTGHGS